MSGFLLRFIPLGIYQFSHDELSAMHRLIFPTISETLQFGVQYTDTHPALIQVFLYYWTKLFGNSEIAVKIPFLICGVAVILLAYRFSKKWFGLHSSLIVSVFFSCSFIFCVYSSYARMYISGVLFSIGCLYFLFNILYNQPGKLTDFLWFGVFCLLSGFNNHINMLFAFTCALSGLILIPKQKIYPYIITCIITIIFYLPHLPITLTQLQIGGLGVNDGGWLPAPKATILIDFIIAILGTGLAGMCNAILLTGVIMFSIIQRKKITSKQWLLLVLFMVNYLIIHLYSVYKSPIFQFSVMLFCGVCLLFFLTSFAQHLTKKIAVLFCVIFSISLISQSIVTKKWFGEFNSHVFEKMTTETFDQVKKHGSENVSSLYFSENYFALHYLLKNKIFVKYKTDIDSVFKTPTTFRNYLASLKTAHLVMGGASPLYIQLAKEYFPYVDTCSESYFYNIITLTKNKKIASEPYIITSQNLLTQNTTFTLETSIKPKSGVYRIDSLSGEFPFAFKTSVKKLNLKEGQWLFVHVKFNEDSMNLSSEDIVCASINTADSLKNYFGGVKFSDFHYSKNTNNLYLQVFVGSNTDEWNASGELAFFIWKKDKSTLNISEFNFSIINYNPTKWKVWN